MKTRISCLAVMALWLGLSISGRATLMDGLVARFDLNGNTLDSSGNNLHAPVSGVHSYVPDRFGNPSSAFRIDAPGVWAQGYGMPLSGSSLSLSFWYQKYWDPLDRAIIRVGTASAAGKQLIVALDYPVTTQPDLRFTFFFNDLDVFATPSQQVDTWYHAVLTYDQFLNERNVYLNGALVASDIAAYGFTGDDYFDFGMYGLALDDLAFYNRVLSADEVGQLNGVPDGGSNWNLALAGLALVLFTGIARRSNCVALG